MNILKNIIYIGIIAATTCTLMLVSWNKGFDLGQKDGYTTGILQQLQDGKLIVECHFKCRPGRCHLGPQD